MQRWKADGYYFQETKLEKDVELCAKQLWSCTWMRCGFLEAQGSSGDILIMWDSRNWAG